MRHTIKTCGLALLMTACGQPEGGGVDPEEEPAALDPQLTAAVEGDLERFERDPRAFFAALPPKLGAAAVSPFDRQAIDSLAFIDAKHDESVGLRRDPDPKADAWGSNDWARNLVDDYALTRLGDMWRLKRGAVAEQPWSDDYWGLYAGAGAKRYADPALPSGSDWKRITDYLRSTPPRSADHLSPAEKYDLLVGDAQKTLTRQNLDTGKPYYEQSGKVETWMGLCHGSAAAAYLAPRPQKAIEVLAADGVTRIKFFPSDIKALSTMLHANTDFATRFIGGRCNVKAPMTDSIGRITDRACRDTNAGTWHLAVVNQVGRGKRSMVLDATFDYEVWNYPVTSYEYEYFNPRTSRIESTLSRARVAAASFPEDKFKAYRAAGTTHIVGIVMTVRWVAGTRPSQATTDGPQDDAVSGARYLYTLELDAEGNIIGGEWLQNAHPDFLWLSPRGTQARSVADGQLGGAWDGRAAVPASWRAAAPQASRYGQPLGPVVSKLIELARQ